MSYICGSSLYVLINIYEKQKLKKHKDLKGGCHNFQYLTISPVAIGIGGKL